MESGVADAFEQGVSSLEGRQLAQDHLESFWSRPEGLVVAAVDMDVPVRNRDVEVPTSITPLGNPQDCRNHC